MIIILIMMHELIIQESDAGTSASMGLFSPFVSNGTLQCSGRGGGPGGVGNAFMYGILQAHTGGCIPDSLPTSCLPR